MSPGAAVIPRASCLLWLCILSLPTGCADDEQLADPHFGDSVRRMIAVQTADPNRGARGMDGIKAEQALEAYREEKADRAAVGNVPLTLTFGGQGGGN